MIFQSLRYGHTFIWLSLLQFTVLSCGLTDNYANEKNDSLPQVKSTGSFRIKGVAVVATVHEMDTAALLDIRQVNANYLAIMPYAFCSEQNPKVQFDGGRQWWGETSEGVSQSILAARRAGFNVMVKPHLWLGFNEYSGDFNPGTEKGWQQWENGFMRYILAFAKIAERDGADLFCIGTEMRGAIKVRPAFWSKLIDSVRKNFTGKLTYAANWDDYEQVPFWPRLDYIGVDAYFPLSYSGTPSIQELTAAWKKVKPGLKSVSAKANVPVIFTEYGYRNASFCAATPWKEKGKRLNNQAQANAYAALFESFAAESWFAGGFAWKWHADDVEKHQNPIDYTPQDKPALKILEQFYARKNNAAGPGEGRMD